MRRRQKAALDRLRHRSINKTSAAIQIRVTGTTAPIAAFAPFESPAACSVGVLVLPVEPEDADPGTVDVEIVVAGFAVGKLVGLGTRPGIVDSITVADVGSPS